MNIYTLIFVSDCPVNGQSIEYHVEITAQRTIFVEDILAQCDAAKTLPKPYHENIADHLYRAFGGKQVIRAFHHGVAIKTTRGEING